MSAQAIRFLLNGNPRSLENPPATRTVLEYLRLDEHLTGTKEGCAEGDCGACTVVLAEEGRDGEPRCRAVNACIQFLPTLDGKALFTVEALGGPTHPHPVQQAMIEHHGSQCGFCTPGFVMSLFALYKTLANPDREAVEDALSGNLCRCTGYRPIIEAAHEMYRIGAALPAGKQSWINAPAKTSTGEQPVTQSNDGGKLLAHLRELRRDAPLASKHDSGAFHAPRTLDELTALRARLPNARLLAGGTDVGLWVTKQLRQIDEVIYLGEVAGLADIHVTATYLDIGAGANLNAVSPLLVRHYPGMREVLRRFASPPIRNAATLGGNIANGSPIGDSMPCLIALGARLVLRSIRGSRELPLEEFFLAYQKTALAADEFVERILVPLPRPNEHFRAYKISKRYDQDISIVLAAILARIEDGRVVDCRIAFGGMAATPKRASRCEAAMISKSLILKDILKPQEALSEDFQPIDDLRGSAAYRLAVARNLLERFALDVTHAQGNQALAGLEPISL